MNPVEAGAEQEQRERETSLVRGSAGFEAWKSLILINSRLMGELDEDMRREHNFSLGEFDVLATLERAPERRRRMCELASEVVLSPSGLSRRVDRLERAGLVQRHRSAEDARSIETTLTPKGRQFFRHVRDFHLAGIKRLFIDRFDEEELETLAGLLGRFCEVEPGAQAGDQC